MGVDRSSSRGGALVVWCCRIYRRLEDTLAIRAELSMWGGRKGGGRDDGVPTGGPNNIDGG